MYVRFNLHVVVAVVIIYLQMMYGGRIDVFTSKNSFVEVSPPPFQEVLCNDAKPRAPAQSRRRLHHFSQLVQANEFDRRHFFRVGADAYLSIGVLFAAL